jgi:hypothetical protein
VLHRLLPCTSELRFTSLIVVSPNGQPGQPISHANGRHRPCRAVDDEFDADKGAEDGNRDAISFVVK